MSESVPRISLTAQERGIIEFIEEGRTYREIAQSSGITSAQVHAMTGALRLKLGATSRRGIADRAVDLGLLKRRGRRRLAAITDSQRRMLALFAQALPPEEIARRLGTTLWNVYGTLRGARLYYGVAKNVHAVEAAVAAGDLTLRKPAVMRNPLSPRAVRILSGLLKGKGRNAIARDIGKKKSVSDEIRVMCDLLHVSGVPELLHEAVQLGLMTRSGQRPKVVPIAALSKRRRAPAKKDVSPRSVQVLHAIAERPHATMEQIAQQLGMGVTTVNIHLIRLRRILGASTRAELFAAAAQRGLVRVPRRQVDERVLLTLFAEGLSNREIASQLNCSTTDVAAVIRALKAKHVCATREGLLATIARLGLVDPVHRIAPKPLSAREKEILKLKSRQLSAPQIASLIGAPASGVRSTLFALRHRYSVKTDAQLIDAAIEAGTLHLPPITEIPNPFTSRELEILEGLLAGLSDREIAQERRVSCSAITACVMSMRSKVRVRTKAELLNEVQRLGLVVARRPTRMIPRATLERMNVAKSADALTPRLQELVRFLERTPEALLRDIAAAMGITKGTAGAYLQTIRKILGARSSYEILERARELRII